MKKKLTKDYLMYLGVMFAVYFAIGLVFYLYVTKEDQTEAFWHACFSAIFFMVAYEYVVPQFEAWWHRRKQKKGQ